MYQQYGGRTKGDFPLFIESYSRLRTYYVYNPCSFKYLSVRVIRTEYHACASLRNNLSKYTHGYLWLTQSTACILAKKIRWLIHRILLKLHDFRETVV